jgi:hypothetical protein
MEAAMLDKPALHGRCLMGSVVVEHEMEIEVLFHAPVDALQELDELLCTVAGIAFADDAPTLRVKGRKQCRGAVALVVVGSSSSRGLSSTVGWAGCNPAA